VVLRGHPKGTLPPPDFCFSFFQVRRSFYDFWCLFPFCEIFEVSVFSNFWRPGPLATVGGGRFFGVGVLGPFSNLLHPSSKRDDQDQKICVPQSRLAPTQGPPPPAPLSWGGPTWTTPLKMPHQCRRSVLPESQAFFQRSRVEEDLLNSDPSTSVSFACGVELACLAARSNFSFISGTATPLAEISSAFVLFVAMSGFCGDQLESTPRYNGPVYGPHEEGKGDDDGMVWERAYNCLLCHPPYEDLLFFLPFAIRYPPQVLLP